MYNYIRQVLEVLRNCIRDQFWTSQLKNFYTPTFVIILSWRFCFGFYLLQISFRLPSAHVNIDLYLRSDPQQFYSQEVLLLTTVLFCFKCFSFSGLCSYVVIIRINVPCVRSATLSPSHALLRILIHAVRHKSIQIHMGVSVILWDSA